MQKLKYFLLTLFISVLYVSCDWLNPEINETNTIYYSAATLISDNKSGENIFLTDDSLYLYPTKLITIPETQKDSISNRKTKY